MNLIYFDNAATTWPKPKETFRSMMQSQRAGGGSPGRSAHRSSIEAARIIYDTREVIAHFFGVIDPCRIVFTKNATEALNIAIMGLLKKGDHCVTSSMEHNSILRPLRFLEATRNIKISIISAHADGTIDPSLIEKSLRPKTRLLILGHASNVTGTIAPIQEVGAMARKHGVHFLVDAAQTAGSLPIDVESMKIDLLAFTGHKSLFGPQGTGGLYIREGLDATIAPLMAGGTGSRSESEEQPDFMPDKYESGTPNTIGLAGLKAGISFIQKKGIDAIHKKEQSLLKYFLSGLRKLPGIKLYGPAGIEDRIAVASFNIEGMASSEAAFSLDEKYGILCRPGLHCAPAAHRSIGTFPRGTLRFGFGYYNTLSQVEYALKALEEISQKNKNH